MTDTNIELIKEIEILATNVNNVNSLLRSNLDINNHFITIDKFKNIDTIKLLIKNDDEFLDILTTQLKSLFLFSTDKLSIRPSHLRTAERTTLMIREAQDETNESTISALIDSEEAKKAINGKVLSYRLEFGNNWYLLFDSEDACANAAMYLRGKLLNNKKISCCVKADSSVPQYISSLAPAVAPIVPSIENAPYSSTYSPPANPTEAMGTPKHSKRHNRDSKRGGRRGDETENPKNSLSDLLNDKLGPEHFPALIGSVKKEPSNSVGYSGSFIKYKREQMATIVEGMTSAQRVLPNSLKGCPVITSHPLTTTQLRNPMTIACPSSPSPMLASRSAHASPAVAPLDITVSPSLGARNHAISAAAFSLGGTAPVPSISLGGLNSNTTKKIVPVPTQPVTNTVLSTTSKATKKAVVQESKPEDKKAQNNKNVIDSSNDTITEGSWSTKRTAASIVASNANKPVQQLVKKVVAPVSEKTDKPSESAKDKEVRVESATKATKETKEVAKDPKAESPSTKVSSPNLNSVSYAQMIKSK